MNETKIVRVETPDQLAAVRELFLEYARALDFHICFENFQKELAQLPGIYSVTGGGLFLAQQNAKTVGCVAFKRIDGGTCEMKRLYVRHEFRGLKIGRKLANTVFLAAREMGYRKIILDTLPQMKEALSLYRSLGFQRRPSDGEKIEMELVL